MKEIKTNGSSRAVIRRSFTSAHILCFANDFALITKTAYECKHSTYIYLFFITLNSLYVEASGGLFVHYIVIHALFGFYI